MVRTTDHVIDILDILRVTHVFVRCPRPPFRVKDVGDLEPRARRGNPKATRMETSALWVVLLPRRRPGKVSMYIGPQYTCLPNRTLLAYKPNAW